MRLLADLLTSGIVELTKVCFARLAFPPLTLPLAISTFLFFPLYLPPWSSVLHELYLGGIGLSDCTDGAFFSDLRGRAFWTFGLPCKGRRRAADGDFRLLTAAADWPWRFVYESMLLDYYYQI